MKKEKLIPIVLVSLASILFIAAIILLLNQNYFEFNNKTENKENSETQIKEENVNTETNNNQDKDSVTSENTNIENNTNTESVKSETSTNNSSSSNNSNNNTSVSKNEEAVIAYFESQDSMITEYTNQEDGTLREKAKNAFITIVDFIFYEREIKGYTFKELTTEAKLKVIKLALSIDHKIDEYFPDYKEVIKDKYTSIKGQLAVKYLEFTSTLCETVGVDTCNQAKEDFNTMKESFGFTWQLVKELASSGSDKIKEFYESWRDSE